MNVAETSIAPWLTVPDGAAALAFYQGAFGARVVYRLAEVEPDVVARLAIGNAEFWISDGTRGDATRLGGGSIRMVLTVADPERVCARALAAGATQVFPVGVAHGWKLGRLTDPFGLDWEIGHLLGK
jgi:PhnB protein